MMFKLLFLKKLSDLSDETLISSAQTDMAYTKELLQALEEGINACGNKKIQGISKKMKELFENEQIRDIRSKDDKDARMLQCPAGEFAIRAEKRAAQNGRKQVNSFRNGTAPDRKRTGN